MQAIMYTFGKDFMEKRTPHRAAHLAYLGTYEVRGKIVAGGALTNGPMSPTRGLILFRGDKDEAHDLVRNDPYFKAALVQGYEVNDWAVVIGDQVELLS